MRRAIVMATEFDPNLLTMSHEYIHRALGLRDDVAIISNSLTCIKVEGPALQLIAEGATLPTIALASIQQLPLRAFNGYIVADEDKSYACDNTVADDGFKRRGVVWQAQITIATDGQFPLDLVSQASHGRTVRVIFEDSRGATHTAFATRPPMQAPPPKS